MSEPERTQLQMCPSCGTELTFDELVCPHCGYVIAVRPAALTVIALLWAMVGLFNLGLGLYDANRDYNGFQYIYGFGLPPWFQFGIPAEFGLNLAGAAFGSVSLAFVYGLATRKTWSFRLAWFLPAVGAAIGLAFLALYLSGPADIAAQVSYKEWLPVASGVFWALVFRKYFNRVDVKVYLHIPIRG